jgi:hypothetical protein
MNLATNLRAAQTLRKEAYPEDQRVKCLPEKTSCRKAFRGAAVCPGGSLNQLLVTRPERALSVPGFRGSKMGHAPGRVERMSISRVDPDLGLLKIRMVVFGSSDLWQ